MWEFTSGIPPFSDRAHDLQLCLSICGGERPKIIENTPQCYIDLMKKCWDKDPLKRPIASDIKNIIWNWCDNIKSNDISEELKGDIMEFWKADKVLEEQAIDLRLLIINLLIKLIHKHIIQVACLILSSN